jgi:SagB-type dehydrogenase family enzyme
MSDRKEKEDKMNRRTFLKSVPALAVLASAQSGFSEENTVAGSADELQAAIAKGGVIKLNQPDLNKGVPLMTALKKRKTERNISDKKLTLQQLSELLWAADGVNRPDGKRTSPAAMAKYAVDIYVVLPEGVYLYDVAKHELAPVAKGDFRKEAGKQDFVYIAPVNLVYVVNLKNWQNLSRPVPSDKRDLWIHIEAGCIVQNVYLYCASEGLGATVRGYIDEKKFSEVIKVKPEQVVLAQTIGHPK